MCLASGFLGLVVLLPLYLHGNRAKPYDGQLWTIMRDPKLISMGNIKDRALLWVPICFAYFTTLHTLYLLKREYKRFLTLRLTYLSVGDPDVNVQKVRTRRDHSFTFPSTYILTPNQSYRASVSW